MLFSYPFHIFSVIIATFLKIVSVKNLTFLLQVCLFPKNLCKPENMHTSLTNPMQIKFQFFFFQIARVTRITVTRKGTLENFDF